MSPSTVHLRAEGWDGGGSAAANGNFRLGIAEICCLFASGFRVAIAFLAKVIPLVGLNSLPQVAGAIIYVVRRGGRAFNPEWTARGGTRLFRASGV